MTAIVDTLTIAVTVIFRRRRPVRITSTTRPTRSTIHRINRALTRRHFVILYQSSPHRCLGREDALGLLLVGHLDNSCQRIHHPLALDNHDARLGSLRQIQEDGATSLSSFSHIVQYRLRHAIQHAGGVHDQHAILLIHAQIQQCGNDATARLGIRRESYFIVQRINLAYVAQHGRNRGQDAHRPAEFHLILLLRAQYLESPARVLAPGGKRSVDGGRPPAVDLTQ